MILYHLFFQEEILLGSHRPWDQTLVQMLQAAQARLAIGKERLLIAFMSWLQEHSAYISCHESIIPLHQRKCNDRRSSLIKTISSHWRNGRFFVPLRFVASDIPRDKCVDQIIVEIDAFRRRMWDDLPKYFDLMPWKDKSDLAGSSKVPSPQANCL